MQISANCIKNAQKYQENMHIFCVIYIISAKFDITSGNMLCSITHYNVYINNN